MNTSLKKKDPFYIRRLGVKFAECPISLPTNLNRDFSQSNLLTFSQKNCKFVRLFRRKSKK